MTEHIVDPSAGPLIEVRMVRDPLGAAEDFALAPPAPFRLRPYAPGDAAAWVAIHREAEEHHADVSEALFRREFGHDEDLLRARQLYLCDEGGAPVGTATAWINDCAAFAGQPGWGRIHWVAVVPRLQGRGLGRALVAALGRRFRELGHDRAYLTTETVRAPAIRLYRSFGFRPDARDERERRIWSELAPPRGA